VQEMSEVDERIHTSTVTVCAHPMVGRGRPYSGCERQPADQKHRFLRGSWIRSGANARLKSTTNTGAIRHSLFRICDASNCSQFAAPPCGSHDAQTNAGCLSCRRVAGHTPL
jgi:hypothetical protein